MNITIWTTTTLTRQKKEKRSLLFYVVFLFTKDAYVHVKHHNSILDVWFTLSSDGQWTFIGEGNSVCERESWWNEKVGKEI